MPDEAAALRQEVPEWRGSDTLDLLQELADVAVAVPARVAARAGLSTSELHTLRHLMTGAMGPADIARMLGVTTAASSGVVDRLQQRGHVQRSPHATDGRRTEVAITDSGRREVIQVLAPMFQALAALDAGLDEADRVAVERYLRGSIAAMRTVM